VRLSCGPRGGVITAVSFASIGTPDGKCGALTAGRCHGDPAKALAYVNSSCAGKNNCTMVADINEWNGGHDPCPGVVKSVSVEVQCSGTTPPPPAPPAPPTPARVPPASTCEPEQWQVRMSYPHMTTTTMTTTHSQRDFWGHFDWDFPT
jgi:hypothetical protein